MLDAEHHLTGRLGAVLHEVDGHATLDPDALVRLDARRELDSVAPWRYARREEVAVRHVLVLVQDGQRVFDLEDVNSGSIKRGQILQMPSFGCRDKIIIKGRRSRQNGHTGHNGYSHISR